MAEKKWGPGSVIFAITHTLENAPSAGPWQDSRTTHRAQRDNRLHRLWPSCETQTLAFARWELEKSRHIKLMKKKTPVQNKLLRLRCTERLSEERSARQFDRFFETNRRTPRLTP